MPDSCSTPFYSWFFTHQSVNGMRAQRTDKCRGASAKLPNSCYASSHRSHCFLDSWWSKNAEVKLCVKFFATVITGKVLKAISLATGRHQHATALCSLVSWRTPSANSVRPPQQHVPADAQRKMVTDRSNLDPELAQLLKPLLTDKFFVLARRNLHESRLEARTNRASHR